MEDKQSGWPLRYYHRLLYPLGYGVVSSLIGMGVSVSSLPPDPPVVFGIDPQILAQWRDGPAEGHPHCLADQNNRLMSPSMPGFCHLAGSMALTIAKSRV
jgi:hypothetical protein